jgi:uncharacterized membrane protein YccC
MIFMKLLQYLRLYWKKYISPVDPFNDQLKLALKSCLAAIICMASIFYFKIPQGLWLTFSTVFVMMMYIGETRKKRFLVQFIGGTTGALGAFIGALIGVYFYPYLMWMIACVFIAFYIIKYGAYLGLPAALCLFLILMSSNSHVNLAANLHRLINLEAGVLLAILLSNLIWPYRPRKHLQSNLKANTEYIRHYLKLVINDALRGNFHRLEQFKLKRQTLQSLYQARLLNKHYHFPSEYFILQQQGHLFNQTAAISDVLSKPNTEYFLDIITPKLEQLSLLLPDAIRTPDVSTLKQLKQITESFKNIIEKLKNRPLAITDAQSLYYLLTQMNKTLPLLLEGKK